MRFRCIALVTGIIVMALVPYRNAQNVHVEEPPLVLATQENDCGCGSREGSCLNIVIAATLDGDLIALDGETGTLLWRHKDDPLLSGTLSTNGPVDIGGSSLQLMPTLDGRLFSYSMHSNLIEPLITTDYLLESTVKLGRDAVAGGKSVSTLGINVVTGEIKYKCSIDSCSPAQEASYIPTLMVKRISNSIRAVDSLQGVERWNLSTAELDLSLVGVGLTPSSAPRTRILLRPPEGAVTATTKYGNQKWTSFVGGHIVGTWHVFGDSIREISLFDPSNIYTTQLEVIERNMHQLPAQTSLFYMGTSNGYPFIIQSSKSKKILRKKMNDLLDLETMTDVSKNCAAPSATIARGSSYEVSDSTLLVLLRQAFGKTHSKMIEDKSGTHGMSSGQLAIVNHGDESQSFRRCLRPRSHGVGLIGTENLRSTSQMTEGDVGYLVLDTESVPLLGELRSLPSTVMENVSWYLKSLFGVVLSGLLGAYVAFRRDGRRLPILNQASDDENSIEPVSSAASAELVLRNCSDESDSMLSRSNNKDIFDADERVEEAIIVTNQQNQLESIPVVEPPLPKAIKHPPGNDYDEEESLDEKNSDLQIYDKKKLARSRTVSRNSVETFVSRFASEFEVHKVIGHGGFGVVFRAKSKVDMNEYAVKRIAVADNKKSRDRVLREARALAVFDHPGIIRYFYAWEEKPPKGYQEKEDEHLLGKIRAARLQKVHGLKSPHKLTKKESVKETESLSFGVSFDMPPVVGNTEDSWKSERLSEKPQQVGRNRTTSESLRGLARGAFSEESSSIVFTNGHSSSRDSSSDRRQKNGKGETQEDSSDSSDSSENISPRKPIIYSSSGGIEFKVDENDDAKDSASNEVSLSERIRNREMIVETENSELQICTSRQPGDCAFLYIVMQLCEERTLEHWIKHNNTRDNRPLPTMKKWIKQLAEALEYLHEKGFIHRDLKPGNVFFSLESKPNREILKIGDLGLATKTNGVPQIDNQILSLDQKHTKNVGTRSYMSPEQIGNQQYTEKIDIFALGLVATELIVPFSTAMERIQTFAAYQKGSTPEILDAHPEAKEFLHELTMIDPSRRPSAKEVVEHSFFS